jgi:hypothetical protein
MRGWADEWARGCSLSATLRAMSSALVYEMLLHIRIAIPRLGGTQCLALSPEHHAL